MEQEYEFKWFKDDFDTDPQTRGRLFETRSALEEERSACFVTCPLSVDEVEFVRTGEAGPLILQPAAAAAPLSKKSPVKVGVILTGEWVPASGTHNVVVSLVNFLKRWDPKSSILGFLGGPQGFARKHYIELTSESVSKYLNQGGADMLGFGSLNAISEADLCEIENLCAEYEIESLVFVGGPNELAHVAQLLGSSRVKIFAVVQSPNATVYYPGGWLPVTLGFDSACCALAENVGNIAMDGLNSGRGSEVNLIRCGSATATMEVALRVRPDLTLIAEEIQAKNQTVNEVVGEIVSVIKSRENCKTTTVLLSDKLYTFLPGFEELRAECRALYVSNPCALSEHLSAKSAEFLSLFPQSDQVKILRAYNQDGNPTMPDIAPERWLALLVSSRLATHNISIRSHFIGHEARCVFPSDFDCALGLALGRTAAALCCSSKNFSGYVACVRNLHLPVQEWECGAIPLNSLLSLPADKENNETTLLGANQELINLAKQRRLREAAVPLIKHRPVNILEDPLYKNWRKFFEEEKKIFAHPFPLQFDANKINITPCAAVLADAAIEPFISCSFSRQEYRPKKNEACFSPVIDCPVTSHRAPQNLVQLAFPHTCSVSGAIVAPGSAAASGRGGLVRVGLVFLGRSAPGSHNIVSGIFDFFSETPSIMGFVNGAQGLITGHCVDINRLTAGEFINSAGISLLGRSETPLRTREELHACIATLEILRLDGLLVVGGLGTHADTALLAELVVAHRLPTRVIGIPASIENDIPLVEQSLGHDTACRVYASIVGSLAALAASKKRQWCFVRLPGKNASHVLTEVALQTHANLVLTAEELQAKRMSLADVVNLICDLISQRARKGLDFGIVLFAESVLDQVEESVPITTNIINMSASSPELLLEALVGNELQRRRIIWNPATTFVSSAFRSSTHVLSQQGRSAHPSNFDCDLGFNLGVFAANLIAHDRTGLLASVGNLADLDVKNWIPRAVPLTAFLSMELDRDSLECCVSIQQRAADFSLLLNQSSLLPVPAERRFVHPGPMQFRDSQRLLSLAIKSPLMVREQKMVEKLSALCCQIMSLSASASDARVREVLTSGLRHTLALMKAHHHELPTTKRETRKKTEKGLLRPPNKCHCRVIQIVPVEPPAGTIA